MRSSSSLDPKWATDEALHRNWLTYVQVTWPEDVTVENPKRLKTPARATEPVGLGGQEVQRRKRRKWMEEQSDGLEESGRR
eukprot:9469599-Pyramimonas_sp.AAC.1